MGLYRPAPQLSLRPAQIAVLFRFHLGTLPACPGPIWRARSERVPLIRPAASSTRRIEGDGVDEATGAPLGPWSLRMLTRPSRPHSVTSRERPTTPDKTRFSTACYPPRYRPYVTASR
jgi:hypothetical protein